MRSYILLSYDQVSRAKEPKLLALDPSNERAGPCGVEVQIRHRSQKIYAVAGAISALSNGPL